MIPTAEPDVAIQKTDTSAIHGKEILSSSEKSASATAPPAYTSDENNNNHGKAPQPRPIPLTALTSNPALVECRWCHAQVTTSTQKVNGDKVERLAAAFCILGGLLCVWIPYVTDKWKETEHRCPACGAVIATVDCDGLVIMRR